MKFLNIITGLIAPPLCEVCARELVDGEESLCTHCQAELPLYMMSRDDLRAARLPRTAPVAGVYPWLTYTNNNPVCSLIREGKYNSRPELFRTLGRLYARSLMAENALDGIDIITPVPMHLWKRMRRGYNQAAVLAETMAKATGVKFLDCLQATHGHKSQTRQTPQGRLENVKDSMALKPGIDIHGLHIGLVDDIITTGATLTEAATVLTAAGASHISIFTLAAATDR